MTVSTEELLARSRQQLTDLREETRDGTARIERKQALMAENVSDLTGRTSFVSEQVATFFPYAFNGIATVWDYLAKFEIVICAFAFLFLVLTIRMVGFTHSAWCYLCIVTAIVAAVFGFYRTLNLVKKNMKKDD